MAGGQRQVSGASGGRHAAVLGHPIGHSLSPILHRAAYSALGLDAWRYDAIDVAQDELAAFVDRLDATWAGLSLTMPLKQTVVPLLDHVEPLAEIVGAVNTVLVQAGRGRPVLTGANTDVHGIVAAFGEARRAPGPGDRATAAVLGAGATAASALAALAQLGCSTPVVYVRSLARAGALMRIAHRMGVEPRFAMLSGAADELDRVDLVVSTLPPHAADGLARELATVRSGAQPQARPVQAIGPADVATSVPADRSVAGVLLDVAYDPRPTALSVAWASRGGVVVGGERMLLHQAAEQVRLMTGLSAPLPAMDAALRAALGGGAGTDPS